MAQIICFIGNKGGTGKTTLSHMLAHGLALFGKYAVAVLTDIDRQPLSKANRSYLPFDARQADDLERALRKLRVADDWYGVARLPSAVNDSARMLALQVMELARIPLPEDRWIPIARQRAFGAAQAASGTKKAA